MHFFKRQLLCHCKMLSQAAEDANKSVNIIVNAGATVNHCVVNIVTMNRVEK